MGVVIGVGIGKDDVRFGEAPCLGAEGTYMGSYSVLSVIA